MTDFTENYFDLQLTFNQPQFIASTRDDDLIRVEIKTAEWFVDKVDFLPLDDTTLLFERVLPIQLNAGDEAALD